MTIPIPENEYLRHPEDPRITYVTREQIRCYHSTAELHRFDHWIYGQTCPLVVDKNGDPIGAYYSWDYERWIVGGLSTEQGADWD